MYELGRQGTQHSVYNSSLLISPGTCWGGLTRSPLNLGSEDLSLSLNAGGETSKAPALVLGHSGCCFRKGELKPWDTGALAVYTPWKPHSHHIKHPWRRPQVDQGVLKTPGPGSDSLTCLCAGHSHSLSPSRLSVSGFCLGRLGSCVYVCLCEC